MNSFFKVFFVDNCKSFLYLCRQIPHTPDMIVIGVLCAVRAVRIYAPPKIDPACECLVGIEGGLLINGGGASTLIIMERERAVGGWDSHNRTVPSCCKVLFWSSSAAG